MTEQRATSKPRVKLLLDYDKCCDILFWEKFPDEHYPKGKKEEMQREYRAKAARFMEFLDKKTKGADVEVGVFSERQAHYLNRLFAETYKNGDCFSNFAELCKSKGWRFNTLLVSDKRLGLAPGTVMNWDGRAKHDNTDVERNVMQSFLEDRRFRPSKFRGTWLSQYAALKAYVLEQHFPEDQKEKAAEKEKWYVLDDNLQVLENIQLLFQQGSLSTPEGIRLRVYRYQYTDGPGFTQKPVRIPRKKIWIPEEEVETPVLQQNRDFKMTEQRATSKRRVKLLLDYDDSCDVLFWETFTDAHYQKLYQAEWDEIYDSDAPPITDKIKRRLQLDYKEKANTLMAFLDDITKDADVEIGVWSLRQDHKINKRMQEKYHNGDCFANFSALCQQKGWRFSKLLVTDTLLKVPPGSVMEEGGKEPILSQTSAAIKKFCNDDGGHPYQGLIFGNDHLILKAYTLQSHFPKVEDSKGKATEEDWYALDDNESYLRTLPRLMERGGLKVPEGIRLHMYRYQHSRCQSIPPTLRPVHIYSNKEIPVPEKKVQASELSPIPDKPVTPPQQNNPEVLKTSEDIKETKSKRRVKFLLDYDGCCDIFFYKSYPDAHYELVHKRRRKGILFTPAIRDEIEREYQAKANRLMAVLDHLAKDAEVEVAVWSNRQANRVNQENAGTYLNGDCFVNFAALCKKKGWQFNTLLASDTLLKLPAGTVMARQGQEKEDDDDFNMVDDFYKNRDTIRPEKYRPTTQENMGPDVVLKAYTLENHLPKDQKGKTSEEHEDWYAFDDNPKIVEGIITLINSKLGVLKVPEGINLHVCRYGHDQRLSSFTPAPEQVYPTKKPIVLSEIPNEELVFDIPDPDAKPKETEDTDVKLKVTHVPDISEPNANPIVIVVPQESYYSRACAFFKHNPGVTKVAVFSAIELFSVGVVYTVAAAAKKMEAVHGFMSATPWGVSSGLDKLATPITPYGAAFLLCVIFVSIYESRKGKKLELDKNQVADSRTPTALTTSAELS